VREGFDCVLRVGRLTDSSLVSRPLGQLELINFASPDYLRRFGVPTALADLAQHRLVHYVPTLGARSAGFEYLDPDEPGTVRSVPMAGPVTVDNSSAYVGACLAGLGLIQVPVLAIQVQIAQGQLVEVLPGYRAPPMPVSLLYPHRRHLSKRVQMFMHWLAGVVQPTLAS